MDSFTPNWAKMPTTSTIKIPFQSTKSRLKMALFYKGAVDNFIYIHNSYTWQNVNAQYGSSLYATCLRKKLGHWGCFEKDTAKKDTTHLHSILAMEMDTTLFYMQPVCGVNEYWQMNWVTGLFCKLQCITQLHHIPHEYHIVLKAMSD